MAVGLDYGLTTLSFLSLSGVFGGSVTSASLEEVGKYMKYSDEEIPKALQHAIHLRKSFPRKLR